MLSLCALDAMLHKKSHWNEKPSFSRNEEWPLLAATRESPCKAMKTQHSPKNKQTNKQKTANELGMSETVKD